MTEVYLAYGARVDAAFERWDWAARPLNVLVALPYAQEWHALRARAGHVQPARTLLDSGAFSVWKSGKSIDLPALVAESLRAEWHESVTLDVIGDGQASLRNADLMRAMGSPAWPVFHVGDPWEHLDHYVQHWPKVGLSCRVGRSPVETTRFYEQCFARHWPRRYHSFGCIREPILMRFPFHSADASSWSLAPFAYRDLMHAGRQVPNLGRGVQHDAIVNYLEVEIEHVLRLQDRLRARWRRDLEKLR